MRRYFFVRDRRIEVEEVEEVAAVKVSRDEQGRQNTQVSSFGDPNPADDAVRSAASSLPDDTLDGFKRAGWFFVRPNERTRAAVDRSDIPENAELVGTVVVRANESIGIATKLLNVQLDPKLSEAEAERVLSETSLHIVRRLKFAPNLYETQARGWKDAIDASVDLHEDSRFVFAEPALIEHIPGRQTPSDPNFVKQWQWSNNGSNGGTQGADVNAKDAWNYTFGAGVGVAVIDNGFDANHEDLTDGVSSMSGHFNYEGSFTPGVSGMPDSNHGTFCAGIVGARRENGRGGVGAAPNCQLILIACLGDQVGTQATLARAVGYAIDPSNEDPSANPENGPDILVCSLGPNGAVWNLTATLEAALNSAPKGRRGKGLPIFWAASNGHNVDVSLDEVVSHRNVIAVVRSDANDREHNAARGGQVELIAPGVDVYSTKSDHRYGTWTGTSFAAPCAAGCAALALSVNMGLTSSELRQIMRDSADKIGGVTVTYDATGHNDDYGFGRVNAYKAVSLAES